VKRVFDVLLAAAGVAVSWPLWLLIAVAIKAEDGGPVFFTQQRVGRLGCLFTAYKFRSMVAEAASTPPRQAEEGDPRITRIGRWLRATAMDELPQLLNIVRGDMSFVGPRALAEGEAEVGGEFVRLDEIPGYQQRHAVRPGLTGLTQVFAPRDLPRARKFRFDLLYVRRAGLCLDLWLIGMSFWITFRGKWEDRSDKV
jgi:lipopolysaccharide/colanic/teichoic acid biosynthesis glycosyltransferase